MFEEAGRSKRPVLLIWGERDTLNPVSTVAQEVKSCFSNVQLKVVPGAGHIAICDKPRQVIFSIVSFLAMPTTTHMNQVQLSLPSWAAGSLPSWISTEQRPVAPPAAMESAPMPP